MQQEVFGTSAILESAVNDVFSLVESNEIARNALPSSASGISSFKRGTPVSAAQPPPSDRSQTALCPNCRQTCALFSEGARDWNTRPHRQCIKCYRGRRVRRSGASPRVDANPPPTSEMVPYSRKCHRKTPHVGKTYRQSPPRRRRRRHRRSCRDNRRFPDSVWISTLHRFLVRHARRRRCCGRHAQRRRCCGRNARLRR